MIPQRRSAPEKERPSRHELIIPEKFDYRLLDAAIAQQVQTAAQRIRKLVKQSIEGVIAIGKELLAVKAALPHGSFVPWLRAEFGWA